MKARDMTEYCTSILYTVENTVVQFQWAVTVEWILMLMSMPINGVFSPFIFYDE